MKLTTLIENHLGNNEALACEHGLSVLIETGDHVILFDTGATGKAVTNARKLGIDLNRVDHIVVSHGHYDHSGGLMFLLQFLKKQPAVFLGKGFFPPAMRYDHFTDEDGKEVWESIGNEFTYRQLEDIGCPIHFCSEDVTALSDDVLIFKNFPMHTSFEHLNPHFRVGQTEGGRLDTFDDEIALGLKTDKGLVVLVGCSHRGIVNMLDTIASRTELPICGVIGGTHLVGATPERLEATIEAFQAMDLQFLALSHCTGNRNIDRLKEAFGDRFIMNDTGHTLNL